MRPKVIVVLLAGAITLLVILGLTRPGTSPTPNAEIPAVMAEPQKPTASPAAMASAQQVAAAQPQKSANAAPSVPQADNTTRYEGYLATRAEELRRLSMMDDPESLETILSEMDNRSPELRAVALEACVQFGSRDAIPRLKEAAARAPTEEEKRSIEEAIEYLKLPSLTEVINERRAQANRR